MMFNEYTISWLFNAPDVSLFFLSCYCTFVYLNGNYVSSNNNDINNITKTTALNFLYHIILILYTFSNRIDPNTSNVFTELIKRLMQFRCPRVHA